MSSHIWVDGQNVHKSLLDCLNTTFKEIFSNDHMRIHANVPVTRISQFRSKLLFDHIYAKLFRLISWTLLFYSRRSAVTSLRHECSNEDWIVNSDFGDLKMFHTINVLSHHSTGNIFTTRSLANRYKNFRKSGEITTSLRTAPHRLVADWKHFWDCSGRTFLLSSFFIPAASSESWSNMNKEEVSWFSE